MALFRKKNQPATENFQTQSEFKPMAWLLAIVTFVITLLIVLILFFAGKWAWNRIFNDDQTSTTQTEGSNVGIESIDGTTPGGESQTNQGDNSTNQNGQAQGSNTGNTEQGGQTSSTNTSTPSQATNQPNTGPSGQEELVRTGPDIDL